jgi:hypothetical protein
MSGWNLPTNNIRDEWDNITHTYRGYDAEDNLVEERPYTPEEIADSQADANAATLHLQALAALATNLEDIDWNTAALAVANPTNAQVVAQLKEVTRQSSAHAKQLNALIRLQIGQLDATT